MSQVLNAKENFLKEIKSATPVNTQMVRKGKKKIALLCGEDFSGMDRRLSQPLYSCKKNPHSKALTLQLKAERGEEATYKREVWIQQSLVHETEGKMPFPCCKSAPGEAASADGQALTSYPEDLAKIIKMLRVFSM